MQLILTVNLTVLNSDLTIRFRYQGMRKIPTEIPFRINYFWFNTKNDTIPILY